MTRVRRPLPAGQRWRGDRLYASVPKAKGSKGRVEYSFGSDDEASDRASSSRKGLESIGGASRPLRSATRAGGLVQRTFDGH